MVTMIRSDLDFILAQIKIAEADARHDADPVNNPDVFGTLLPNSEVPWGLRRVDGSNNNLTPGQESYGAAGEPFPRGTAATYINETDDGMAFGPPRYIRQDPADPTSPYVFPLTPEEGFEGDPALGVPAGYQVGVNYLLNNNYAIDQTPNLPVETLDIDTANDPAITNPRAIQPGDVVDADPRTISNLIVDQTANNPAAVFKALQDAGYTNAQAFTALEAYADAVQAVKAARLANDPSAEAGAELALRALLTNAGITLEEEQVFLPGDTPDILKATLYIGNVAADEGLSAPFNGWMTMFGQFFDHGLDLVAKGGFGTVYIPLAEDDPLYVPNGSTNFMALTRSTLGPDGQPVNIVTPFVDQNQTYTSNASHQVFLREYVINPETGRPEATGRLLDGNPASGGGLATWADVKKQALEVLGIELNDQDIHHVPEVLVDAYGNFIPDPDTGFAQLVRYVRDANGVIQTDLQGNPIVQIVSGTPESPVKTADGYVPTGVAFLDDIAHAANPDAGEVADSDSALGLSHTPSEPGERAYDNELLDAHYITGDGRGNENIGLTAVHHVFHSEHNRQVDLIQNLLIDEAKDAQAELDALLATAVPVEQADIDARDAAIANATAIRNDKLGFLNEWLDEPLVPVQLAAASIVTVDWNGERIFQAAKLPTEMQYQHLVFEEFARKVQPAVNLFNDYDGTLDPAILGEFAHTVYRFGHSMLTETVDRYTSDWQSIGSGGVAGGDQIGLIEAFLNPIEFDASGVNAYAAAGVIAQGMTRQRGNEIDEFVTEALRNNLVGLPLDLAALNIARGRETGVPSLNEAREQFFAGSGDTQVKPYESWFEFMQNLKNPASVINFIAAYGTHDSITGAEGLDAKRAAATLLVLGGDGAPTDRLDFLHSKNAWAGDADLGGLNNIDFWIGGLAEKKLIFGGMLGSTFNFVFETQLEALQNGDRFYYLSRLANLNLTAQLENNKFSEMIHRNTTATHLPGDAFARPDFFLEADQSKQFNDGLGNSDPTGEDIGLDPFLALASNTGSTGAVIRSNVVGTVAGKLEYTGAEHVVLGGTAGNDWLVGGLGDDTLWGDKGDDRLEGGDGNDFIFGGDGNDIITDLFGIDEIRSGAGDDVVSAGRGIKLIITDTGNDWVWGGVDDDEVLAGQGNDFVNGGDGADFLIGGEGNDWLESGTENGLMLGDNGDLVQGLPIKRSVDSRIVGHDVLLATGGNADFDAETGDDIMVGGLGTDRFFGQFGFDWATYKFDNFGIEADMNNRLFAPPSLPASPGAILDRYAQTEGLSGSAKNDILRGDDVADLAGGGEGAIVDGLDHALYDFNVDLIAGLDELLGSINEDGAVRFSAGNILLGGAMSDIIEGRGGNDVIDGDAWLNVRIIYIDPADQSVESSPTMAAFQQRVLAGEIKVADLQIVREIVDDADAIDIAEYSGLQDNYVVEIFEDGTVTVTDLVGNDGVDRLTNVERLLFADGTIKITEHANEIATGAPVITADGPLQTGTKLTVTADGIDDAEGVGQIVFYWQVELVPDSGVFTNIQSIVADEFAPITGSSFVLTDAEAGLRVRALARFLDGEDVFETVVSAPTDPINGAPGGGLAGAPVVNEAIAILGLDLTNVQVDGAPLAPGTVGILEDTTTPFVFSVDDLRLFVTDPNNDPLTFTNIQLRVRDGELPPGTLTPLGNGQFSFLPAENFNGGVTFTFDVSDGTNVVPGEATLEVIAVNDAPVVPVVDLGDVPAGPEIVLTFTLADLFGNTPTDANGRAIDIDGDRLEIDPLSISATIGTIADLGNDTFTLTVPAGTPIGSSTISYQITDGLVTIDVSTTVDITNFAPTGAPILSDLGPTQTQAVTVDTAAIADANGITGPFSIQWQRAPDAGGVPGTWTNITGAIAETFTPGSALVNQFLRAQISYTDGSGTVETLFATASRVTGAFLNGVNTGPNANDTLSGTAGDDLIRGNGGNDILSGNAGDDEILGGLGNDVIDGGSGDDTITWVPGGARDVVTGGTGGIDTFKVNGNNADETFRIYSNRDDADGPEGSGTQSSAAAAGFISTSEIVITRAVGNGLNQVIIAELSEIEEYVIDPGTGTNVIQIIGDFSQTSLSPNTITVDGTKGKTKVDATKFTSSHHIAFYTEGNDDTLVGGRVQDEVFGTTAAGSAPASQFFYTGRDVTELKNLVAGRPSNYADDGASGIRDLEGTGNNVASPNSGAADQNFIRLTDARYGEDGSINPIHQGLDPRAISNILGDQEANLAKNGAGTNIFFMAFGQYVDHGLDFLPKDDSRPKLTIGTDALDDPADLTRGKISGYDENGDPEYHNQASPFVDQNQAYGSTEVVGQLLRESAGGGKVGAHLLKGATDPSNADFALLPTLREALKHHWEADTKFTDLAKGINGVTLKSFYPDLIDGLGNFNPAVVAQLNANFLGSGYQLVGDANFAINILDHYVAGDLRANENYTLTSIHTVWARNHNYHVERLLASGFDGSQEELFQAAKIVNEAEYQRVVFTEFTDYLLGGLKGGGQHGHDEYNPAATAQISHEFAAAAYRFGHSQIGDTITILDDNGNPKSVNLFDAFLNPTDDPEAFLLTPAQLAQYGYSPQPGFEQIGVSDIIGGIVRQQAEEVDFNVVDAVRNDLVRIRADLFAFNVARGWDVGLGTLNQVRAGLLNSTDKYVSEAVELSDEDLAPYASWEDFQNRNGLSDAVINQFKAAYPDLVLEPGDIAAFELANPDIDLVGGNTVKGIDRVDLWVGGLAEKHINGGTVGSTFWVILHEQFDRLQEADRFYYLDRVGDADFYEALKELEFSDIVKRNTGLTDLPKDIFSATDKADDDDETIATGDDTENQEDDDTTTGSDGDDVATGDGADDDVPDEDGDQSNDESESETEGDEAEDDETEEDESEDEDDDAADVDEEEGDDGTTTGGPTPGTGSATSSFVVYLGAAVASETALGGTGNDVLSGGDGDDHLFGYGGDDDVIGGDGDDYLDGGDGDDILDGGRGGDVIKGGAGDDEVNGGAGRDIINTGAGNDVIFVRNNDAGDVIDAGDELGDSDPLDMSAISANITVYLSAHGSGSAVAGDTTHSFKGVENVVTGDGDDVLMASSEANILEGGGGRDTFVFSTVNAGGGEDVIKDLNFHEGDTIDLSPLFSSLVLGDVTFTNADFSASGRVRLTTDNDSESTLVEVSTDGDQSVELAIRILGRTDLDHKDFGIV
ncbi:MAG: hypothetical protein B7Y80_08700 [Hyphomicrobium sp. 32-62-53]|nr:MAG: hypothetical protein B7Y80_08700 [Hyphomicrobium sp. 32-62-53]